MLLKVLWSVPAPYTYPFGRNVQAAAAGVVPPVLLFVVVQLFVAALKFSERIVNVGAVAASL